MTPRAETRYAQIAEYLHGLVATGSPGDRLPSDAELCERFSVSRMTARQAVQVLVNERLLYRRRGQGTFIAPRPLPRLLGSPLSFTESMLRRGRTASSRVLAAGMAEPTGEERAALGLEDGRQIALLERLRLADGIPMALERAVLVPDLAGILDEDLEKGSLHSAMERMGRIPIRARAEVTARLATADERSLLDLGSDGVLLCERRVISDQDGRPFENTETRYAAQRYVFEAILQRDG